MTFGAAIPAYRNPDGLRRCLTSIAAHCLALSGRISITDDSGGGEVHAALHGEFKSVTWTVNRQNAGFIAAANNSVLKSYGDIVILLNDDVELVSDPVPVLERLFADRRLFAVTFRSQHADGAFREGAKRIVWPFGMPRVLHNERDQYPASGDVWPSDYAVGGHAAFRREVFLKLGGFDSLFHPFYWEDADLSARARRCGWRIVYHPECRVLHAGASAIRTTFQSAVIRETTERNRLLFAWRHMPRALRGVHAASLAIKLTAARLRCDAAYLAAYRNAKARWRSIDDPALSRGGA